MSRTRVARESDNSRLIAHSAALMFAGAALLGAVECALPGGETVELMQILAALGTALLLCLAGPMLPSFLLALLGPIAVAMAGVALGTTDGVTDGAVLYLWPVVWEVWFFGRRGLILIAAAVGATHAAVLSLMPAADWTFDRWFDVMASVFVVGGVVEVLTARNRVLLAKISAEARADALTGLLNRRGFDERAEVEIARARREGHPLALVAFDLDHFKRINDEFGHDVGDRVLVRLADTFRRYMRQTDVIARLGGEEFVALLPDTDLKDGRRFAERVRRALDATEETESPAVTLSAGIAVASALDSIEALLKRADVALYAAKKRGRNRIYVDSLITHAPSRTASRSRHLASRNSR